MKSYFLVILLLFHWGYSSACDCIMINNLIEAQKISFEENDLIFVGRVTEINNDGRYALEIIELFKRNIEGLTKIYGIPDKIFCSIIPENLYETWLVYSNLDPSGKISISEWGLSRSFHFPHYSGSPFLPPPPPPPPLEFNDPITILELEFQILDLKKRLYRN